MSLQERFDWSKPFVAQSGLEYVRGCEVEGMLDENGRVIEEGEAYSDRHVHVSVVGSSPTRGSSFFFGKVTALGVLCCFALLFV